MLAGVDSFSSAAVAEYSVLGACIPLPLALG